jgi:hypothetical protein
MTTPTPALTQPRMSRTNKALIALWSFVGLLLVWFALSDTGDEPYTPSGDSSGARAACRILVEDRLVAPSTADFSDLTTSEGTGDRWTVTGSVDAENRMGVPIRMDFTCVVQYDGGDWRLIRMSGLNG